MTAGTGLGEAASTTTAGAKRLRGLPSEAALRLRPRDAREQRLHQFLRAHRQPTTWESVVSGPGLRTIYDFLRTEGAHGEGTRLRPHRAQARSHHQGRRRRLVPAVPGDDAPVRLPLRRRSRQPRAQVLRHGRVWLGGSIAESLASEFRGDLFLNAFSAHGPTRIREMLAKIPIHLIKFELNGLYGAANFAREM
jgi:glucokinase